MPLAPPDVIIHVPGPSIITPARDPYVSVATYQHFDILTFAIPAGNWCNATWGANITFCQPAPGYPLFGPWGVASGALYYPHLLSGGYIDPPTGAVIDPSDTVSEGWNIELGHVQPSCQTIDFTWEGSGTYGAELYNEAPGSFPPLNFIRAAIIALGAAGGGTLTVGIGTLFSNYVQNETVTYNSIELMLFACSSSVSGFLFNASNYEDEQGYYDWVTCQATGTGGLYDMTYWGSNSAFESLDGPDRVGAPITLPTSTPPPNNDQMPRLMMDTRGVRYCMFWRPSGGSPGVYESTSNDDGLSWNTEYLVFSNAKKPAIARKNGAIFRMAFKPIIISGTPQTYGNIIATYQGDGDQNPSAPFLIVDGSGTPLVVEDDDIGLESLEEGPDRWTIQIAIHGSGGISSWTCQDDLSSTWDSIISSGFAFCKHPLVRRKRGAIIRMAFLPVFVSGIAQNHGTLRMTYQADGDAAPGSEFTVQGLISGTMQDMVVVDDIFSLASLEENADRWGLIVTMYADWLVGGVGNSLYSQWASQDDANGTFVEVIGPIT